MHEYAQPTSSTVLWISISSQPLLTALYYYALPASVSARNKREYDENIHMNEKRKLVFLVYIFCEYESIEVGLCIFVSIEVCILVFIFILVYGNVF